MMELKSLHFELMSYKDMEKLATYEVTKHRPGPNGDTTGTVFDSRAGAQNNRKCGTCFQGAYDCPGHFGIIKLARPILHPLFLHQIRDIIRLICRFCKFPVIKDAKGIHSHGPKRLADLLKIVEKRGTLCAHCSTPVAQYKLSSAPSVATSKAKKKIHRSLCQVINANTKVWLSDEDVADILEEFPEQYVATILGTVHPSRLVLRAWLAIPPACRHLENGRGDVQRDDDLTVLLCDIVRLNNKAKDVTCPMRERDKAMIDLKTKISVYCTNTAKVKRNDNGDMVRGIIDRTKGKHGLIRNNLLGKRSEMSGRTVIGPDPTLRLEEVGMPRSMANHLYVPEAVNESNLERAREIRLCNGTRPRIIRNGKMRKECEPMPGDMICRPLRNGDIVLMNRQPTLHKGSMMAFRVRIHDSLTFTLNLAVTKAFNADFDGDEMNCFVPQSPAAQVEMAKLSTPSACLNSGDRASVCIVQDCLTAAYLMSKESIDSTTLPVGVAYDIVMASRCSDVSKVLCKIRRIQSMFELDDSCYNGKILLSICLPDGLYYTDVEDGIVIEDGVLIDGRMTKRTLGATKTSLIRYIGNSMGRDLASEFVDRLQFVTTAWMAHRGFTVHAGDFMHAGEHIDEIARARIAEASEACSMIMDTTLRERRINSMLANATDVGMSLIRDTNMKDSNLTVMIESGSKGDYFNVGQTKGMLGQQFVNGDRIPFALNEGRRTIVHSKFEENDGCKVVKNRGFISRGFSNGLSPREWIFHCMSGRESVCSSATETADTGYTTRRVNKFSEDIVVHNDGTVADNCDNTYQLTYGNVGFDPEKTTSDLEFLLRSVGCRRQ